MRFDDSAMSDAVGRLLCGAPIAIRIGYTQMSSTLASRKGGSAAADFSLEPL